MNEVVPYLSDEEQQARLNRCERRIDYQFEDRVLLRAALTHASGAEHRLASNERLEFLGDAILGAVVCEELFKQYPDYLEGDLTKIKSVVVSRQTCAKISEALGLYDCLILGKGMAQHPEIPPSLLADVFESLVAAIYLDGGDAASRRFIVEYIGPEIELCAAGELGGNYKSLLQQFAQREFGSTPVYQLLDEKGPDHAKCFKVSAMVGGRAYQPAWGRNKKEAEQRAACNALSELNEEAGAFPVGLMRPQMTVRCVALFSGGLDSMLAVRMMQEQQVEVEALNFKTIFTCCQDQAGQAARDLGVQVTIIPQEDDYLDLVRNPRFGYGKGANPCVDCRIYMFEKAKRFMERMDAQFIVSGEVVGQRPMSQKRRDLDVISYHSHCDDLLLRPLSAKLLPPTLPEREGWVDRDKLFDFQGRSRKGLIALAREFGLSNIPTPSTGCALTEPRFSLKVFDLFEMTQENRRWDFELLKVGRHFRFDDHTKVVVGRNETENDQLIYMHQLPESTSTATLCSENFNGPQALIIGPVTEPALDFAGGLLLRYSREFDPDNALVLVEQSHESRIVQVHPNDDALKAKTLATM